MSSRVFKVFGKTFSDGIFNVLIHSTYKNEFLCVKSNALMIIGDFAFKHYLVIFKLQIIILGKT